MDLELKLEALLTDARRALAAMEPSDNSVVRMLDRVGSLRYAEGTLVGFLDALVLTDPRTAAIAAPRIETFIREAIAARIFLG